MDRIYLDNAAATRIDKSVLKKMTQYLEKGFGNPGSIHKEGVEAKKVLDSSRLKIAKFFNAHEDEIVFTSSGTEANNLAILGFFDNLLKKSEVGGAAFSDYHAIVSVIEHHSVLDVFASLEKSGLAVTYVAVSESGHVELSEIKNALKENTVFISVMYANNEIGTVQPIREITKLVRSWRKDNNTQFPVVHTDACQAISYLDVNVARLNVDLLTASSSKIYGPKGVGLLYKRRGVELSPIIYGGGQEAGLRSGTENVAGIVGCAEAVEIVEGVKDIEGESLTEIQKYFECRLRAEFPDCVFNGSGERVPSIVNVSFPDIESEEMVLRFDAKGIAVASKSACKSSDDGVSYVVRALGVGHCPESAIRFSMGRDAEEKNIDRTIEVMKEIFKVIKK